MVSLQLSPRVQPPRRPSRRPRASKGHVYPSLGDPPPRSPPITSNISPALYRSISTHFGSQCIRIRRTKRLNASFLVDRLEDRTEHRTPLPPLSSFPRFGGARGNAKSAALIGTSLVARFNGLTEREREKFATGPPGANSTQRRSFRNERRPVVVAARRGERTTLRMTIRALHHLETTFRRYRHHRRRRHLHHHSSLAHLHSLLATSTSTSFTNTTP